MAETSSTEPTIDRSVLDARIDALRGPLTELARRIHDNPELRYQEHKAARWIAELVAERGSLEVERELAGLATALRAQTRTAGGPTIAILAEYDALPEIGHACGHNLIAAGAVGAFLALAQADELPGIVQLIGTPAEEGGGGKIQLLEAEVFAGVDAAMMFHPMDRDLLAHPALASLWLDMRFRGSPAHAAASPWNGRSALTACMDTFRLIDSQRIHFRDGVRVHGFITDGGQAVNVIPERAACRFSVRAADSKELARVRAIVERCARGAAMASGVEVDIELQRGYREMRNNMAMARRFGAALETLGRAPRERDDTVGAGSTDMGDVSQVVPSIHPYMAICGEGEAMCHQRSFAACARSDDGIEGMIVAAKAMARTAADLLEQPELVASVRAEFEAAART